MHNLIKNAQKINKDILTSATVNMNSTGKRKVNAFSDLLKNKKDEFEEALSKKEIVEYDSESEDGYSYKKKPRIN